MFFLWSSSLSPCRTNSPVSRFPIAVIPASTYAKSQEENLTLQAVAKQITNSFNRLCSEGIQLREMKSIGGSTASCLIGDTCFVLGCNQQSDKHSC